MLERGYEGHEWGTILLNTDWLPFLESLEDHPRYQDLLRGIAFPGSDSPDASGS